MSKSLRMLGFLLLLLVMAPVAFADDSQPIRIKSAVIETEDPQVIGEVTICNTERERVRFMLDVKNLTINSLYKRNLSVAANSCEKIRLRFSKNFAEMSNTGDEIVMTLGRVSGLHSKLSYRTSSSYTTRVVKGKRDYAGCADQTVKDGIFGACDMDFIYHQPSGLRIKVLSHDSDYVLLKLTHIEWGGSKEMKIYKGRSKNIRSNYTELKRVELTNIYGEGGSDLYLKLES